MQASVVTKKAVPYWILPVLLSAPVMQLLSAKPNETTAARIVNGMGTSSYPMPRHTFY